MTSSWKTTNPGLKKCELGQLLLPIILLRSCSERGRIDTEVQGTLREHVPIRSDIVVLPRFLFLSFPVVIRVSLSLCLLCYIVALPSTYICSKAPMSGVVVHDLRYHRLGASAAETVLFASVCTLNTV